VRLHMSVVGPQDLANQFSGTMCSKIVGRTIKHSYANFGKIPYGTVLVERERQM
jgi:hypothetical protein